MLFERHITRKNRYLKKDLKTICYTASKRPYKQTTCYHYICSRPRTYIPKKWHRNTTNCKQTAKWVFSMGNYMPGQNYVTIWSPKGKYEEPCPEIRHLESCHICRCHLTTQLTREQISFLGYLEDQNVIWFILKY